MSSLFCNGRPVRQRLPVLSALLSAALLSAFAFNGSLCSCAETVPNGTIGLDASHVRTEMPSKLITDQVFEASVTMSNSGTGAWGDGLKLRSLQPLDNRNWGTDFIYIGQGRGCPPGDADKAIRANAGSWWDDTKNILYWSYYHGYCTFRPPVLGASRLVEGKDVVHYGPWSIPESIPWFKSYWGGVTQLPESFAKRYTGGRRLALGFGGYYSICTPASRGPALAAISEPDPRKDTLDVVELLTYPWAKEVCAPRNGDYFIANCSWGGQPPESPARGFWTMGDSVRAGVFIDLPEKHGFLALAYLGTGRIGYDYGATHSAGRVCSWYFYDPEDLGEVTRGKRKPWEVAPHSRSRIDYPRGIKPDSRWGSTPGDPTGCCFDPEASLLYVYQRFCIDNGTRELFPCIHVYLVK